MKFKKISFSNQIRKWQKGYKVKGIKIRDYKGSVSILNLWFGSKLSHILRSLRERMNLLQRLEDVIETYKSWSTEIWIGIKTTIWS